MALGEKVWARIDDVSQQIFGQDSPHPVIYAKHEGFMDFVVMWDHWHDSLKDLVGHHSISKFRPDPAFEKRYLWDDSSDEETWLSLVIGFLDLRNCLLMFFFPSL